jgi:hypothetical protein
MDWNTIWNTFINICTVLNIVYATIDLFWQTHDPEFWNEDAARIVSLTIGGYFSGCFLINAIVRIFELLGQAHSESCECLCFWIEIVLAFVRLGFYILGARLIGLEKKTPEVLLSFGWTVGSAGHIFSLMGTLRFGHQDNSPTK